jgi:hypothetical protein
LNILVTYYWAQTPLFLRPDFPQWSKQSFILGQLLHMYTLIQNSYYIILTALFRKKCSIKIWDTINFLKIWAISVKQFFHGTIWCATKDHGKWYVLCS